MASVGGGMTSLLGIIAGISAVLAIVVASLFIGVCLAVAWISDGFRGHGRHGAPGEGGRRAARH